jgi:hypothetical protein
MNYLEFNSKLGVNNMTSIHYTKNSTSNLFYKPQNEPLKNSWVNKNGAWEKVSLTSPVPKPVSITRTAAIVTPPLKKTVIIESLAKNSNFNVTAKKLAFEATQTFNEITQKNSPIIPKITVTNVKPTISHTTQPKGILKKGNTTSKIRKNVTFEKDIDQKSPQATMSNVKNLQMIIEKYLSAAETAKENQKRFIITLNRKTRELKLASNQESQFSKYNQNCTKIFNEMDAAIKILSNYSKSLSKDAMSQHFDKTFLEFIQLRESMLNQIREFVRLLRVCKNEGK